MPICYFEFVIGDMESFCVAAVDIETLREAIHEDRGKLSILIAGKKYNFEHYQDVDSGYVLKNLKKGFLHYFDMAKDNICPDTSRFPGREPSTKIFWIGEFQ